jgi:hypothetical protein
MKKITKLFITALSFILIISLIPFSVLAEEGMGSESPLIQAVFTDENGETAEGDFLTAGDYTVDITLSGMAAFSVFELTADYNVSGENDIEITSVSTIADTNETVNCGGIKNEDNSFAVILASTNENNTPISDGEVMITLQVTVNKDGDFSDFFVVDEGAELTFVEASYEYGYEAAYVCTSVEAVSGKYYPMLSYDMSPDLTVKNITVTGKITISKDSTGSDGEFGIGGIKVLLGDEEIAVSEQDGSFTAIVPKGTTELTLTGETTVRRTVYFSGENDISNVNIPVVVVDYQKDGIIDYRDVALFVDFVDEPDAYNLYGDIQKDGIIDYRDVALFVDFVDVTVAYASLSLD